MSTSFNIHGFLFYLMIQLLVTNNVWQRKNLTIELEMTMISFSYLAFHLLNNLMTHELIEVRARSTVDRPKSRQDETITDRKLNDDLRVSVKTGSYQPLKFNLNS